MCRGGKPMRDALTVQRHIPCFAVIPSLMFRHKQTKMDGLPEWGHWNQLCIGGWQNLEREKGIKSERNESGSGDTEGTLRHRRTGLRANPSALGLITASSYQHSIVWESLNKYAQTPSNFPALLHSTLPLCAPSLSPSILSLSGPYLLMESRAIIKKNTRGKEWFSHLIFSQICWFSSPRVSGFWAG